jgi:S-formylglutathione hydrolase FrmB
VIVACADGTYCGTNRFTEQHSFYVNGAGGRFEDHVMLEVLPFLLTNFSIRPEREAHAIAGISAGGFGALSLVMRRREYFSKVTVLAGPVNLRYNTIRGKYFGEFRPQTYAWREVYNPREVVGRYFGVLRLRAQRLIGAVFGPADELLANVEQVNPADLLFRLDIKPGELEIYLNFPSHDNFNFDAQAQSFGWLAAQQGLNVELRQDRLAQHLVPYFHQNHKRALDWLCPRLLPPTEPALSADAPPEAESSSSTETITPKFGDRR